MNIYFAPLEGITGFVLRNAYESCFPGRSIGILHPLSQPVVERSWLPVI